MDQKYVLKFNFLRKVQSPAGFEAMTYRFEVNAPTHCSTLLGTNFGKEKLQKFYLILWFIFIGITSQNGGVPFYYGTPIDMNVDKNIL